MKVFAVNSGSYSGYQIDALFSTEKRAQDFMAAVPNNSYGGYNDIQEFTLDPTDPDLMRQGFSIWQVQMLRDDTVERVNRVDINSITTGHTREKPWIWYRSQNVKDALTHYVWAKNEKTAVKITNEVRSQMIAKGE